MSALLALAGSPRLTAAPGWRDAVQQQNAAAVRVLLQQRADVNRPQGDGATALHWAAHWDDRETAALLLKAGANVNAATDQGITPLMQAALNGSTAFVDTLLKAGANPNLASAVGETALMTAAQTGNVELVRLLLAHGADVKAVESFRGQTALMRAVAEQSRRRGAASSSGTAPTSARGRSTASRRSCSRRSRATWTPPGC